MNPFFEYLLKSTISLSLLYLLFKVFMQNDKTLLLNRFLLLGILFVSAVIPLLNFQFFQPEVPVIQVERFREFVSVPLFDAEEIPVTEPSVSQPVKNEINYWMLIYGGAVLILVIRLLVSVGRVLQLIQKAEKQKLKHIVLAVVKEMIQPFTFLNHVVLSEKDLNENKKIIVAHEQAHIKQLHAIDMAVCEVFTLLHFFNPLMWLLRRDLKLNHEYLADQAVLNKGIDAQIYQLLVLQKAVGERRFALANNFSQKPILKRIKMMKKKKNRWNGLKLMLFVPFTTALLMSFSKTAEITSPKVNLIEQNVAPKQIVQEQNEKAGFIIEIKRDGNYIDNKMISLEEVVRRAKSWQKTGREDILLIKDESISFKRVDEIREALQKANVYHVNQRTVNSDEIIYPAGDVTKLAEFSQGKFEEWMREQLKPYLEGIPKDQEYNVFFGFIIDKNGKVSEGHVINGNNPEINEAYNKVLNKIPDWIPAKKGNSTVSVYHTIMDGRKNYSTVIK
ncbi:M56 family metallopeptidase [Mariniphaga sp.]|uniref:M56 family metallopeptidase n=1 Tax=Mariniphaga sp. TaxID=1954475 RepID=UPI0035631E83